jgi:hypothetical protein
MSEKIIGYLLLTMGVGIIILTLLNGYGIFSGTLQPVPFFNFSPISLDLGATKQELLSGRDLSQSTNFFLHLILLGFFANIGFKLASLGIQLLRPIKIEVKDNKVIQ